MDSELPNASDALRAIATLTSIETGEVTSAEQVVAAVTELRDAAELALYRLTIDNGATATRRPESISEADRNASWALANTDVVRRLSAALPKVHVPTAD